MIMKCKNCTKAIITYITTTASSSLHQWGDQVPVWFFYSRVPFVAIAIIWFLFLVTKGKFDTTRNILFVLIAFEAITCAVGMYTFDPDQELLKKWKGSDRLTKDVYFG